MPSWVRGIDSRLDGDRKWRQLSKPQPNAQTLFLYFLWGPYNEGMPGLFEVRLADLADRLEWSQDQVRHTMGELEGHRMAHADWDSGVVWLPNWHKQRHNLPSSSKNVKGWENQFGRIPESELKDRWYLQLVTVVEERGWTMPWGHDVDGAYDGAYDGAPDASLPLPLPQTHPHTPCVPDGTLSGEPRHQIPFGEIIAYLNAALAPIGRGNYRATTKKTQSLIRARWGDGYRVDDFKTVIDGRVATWGGDAKMVDYLRPETLFGTKFEGYLNAAVGDASGLTPTGGGKQTVAEQNLAALRESIGGQP